jgi:hypothetical protein
MEKSMDLRDVRSEVLDWTCRRCEVLGGLVCRENAFWLAEDMRGLGPDQIETCQVHVRADHLEEQMGRGGLNLGQYII